MLRRAVAVFPQLKNAKVEFAWGGFVDITRNRAPHFGKLAPNILFLQGFSGHGLALTGLAGKLAAEAVAGQSERFDVFAQIPHARFPGGQLFRTPAWCWPCAGSACATCCDFAFCRYRCSMSGIGLILEGVLECRFANFCSRSAARLQPRRRFRPG